jgi:hypothetical protein
MQAIQFDAIVLLSLDVFLLAEHYIRIQYDGILTPRNYALTTSENMRHRKL